jgi:hypothetical protein
MTIQELAVIKRWHVAHRRDHPVEFHTWDLVLTAWLAGWVGLPTAWLLAEPLVMLACFAALFIPAVYVRVRLRLHGQHRLRCDWEYVVRAAHAMH